MTGIRSLISRECSSTSVPGGKKKGSSSSHSKDKDKDKDDDDEDEENGKKKTSKKDDSFSAVNALSLSGLLIALHGVADAEGRIVFATTSHLDRLDPTLSRPGGRMDVSIEFENASPWQAEALFCNVLPCTEPRTSTKPRSPNARVRSTGSLRPTFPVAAQSGGLKSPFSILEPSRRGHDDNVYEAGLPQHTKNPVTRFPRRRVSSVIASIHTINLYLRNTDSGLTRRT